MQETKNDTSPDISLGFRLIPSALCRRCGNKWIIRVQTPKYCPRCKSPYWNLKRMRSVSKVGILHD